MLSQFIKFLVAIVTFFIPVNKKLYLFGSWYGQKYGDNARYFFEWLVKQDNDIQAVWVTKSPALATELKEKELPVTQERSLASFWLHLRAGAVFCNTSQDSDLWGATLNRKTKVFNLWHGTPIKKIGLDALDGNFSAEKLGIKAHHKRNQFIPKALFSYLKAITQKDTYFLASSPTVSGLLQSAMGVQASQIIIDGYPKLDHLIKADKKLDNGHILYAPTYRGKYNSENDLLSAFNFDIDTVNKWLLEYNKHLTIRLHPANKLPETLTHALNEQPRIKVGGEGDLYESLIDFELVVTDFSSLYYDCLAIKVPVVLAPFGLSSYTESDRALYFSPQELYPGKLAEDWPSLLELLPEVYQNPVGLYEIRHLFYVEDTGESSSSLHKKVLAILNK